MFETALPPPFDGLNTASWRPSVLSDLSKTRAIIVHGGAGSGKFTAEDPRFAELGNAVAAGLAAMKKGSSLDGAVEAVRYMEESGKFNAGRGACLTMNGEVQLDAAVAHGSRCRGAGVGVSTCSYHPVLLARYVMEATDHALIAGRDCEKIAKAAGIPIERLAASDAAASRYLEMKRHVNETHPKHARFASFQDEGDTVGAVALDSDSVPSAAVSTGGMWLKLPGRIGDSAILGAGVYADSAAGAACATGSGEEILRSAMSWNACAFLKRLDADSAARRAVGLVTRRSGRNTAGIITVDLKGRVGYSYNTEAMGRAWFDREKDRVVVRI